MSPQLICDLFLPPQRKNNKNIKCHFSSHQSFMNSNDLFINVHRNGPIFGKHTLKMFIDLPFSFGMNV